MRSTPCPSSTTGLSSLGTLLLALAGAGLALFLFLVLPRLSESRAAGSGRAPSEAPPEDAPRIEPPAADLVAPVTVEPQAPPPQAQIVAVTSTTIAQPAGEEVQAKADEPKLKYMKGGGQAEKVDHRDMRAENRERRKERREKAAQGIAPETEQVNSRANLDRKRLSNRGGTGHPGQGKGKPKGR